MTYAAPESENPFSHNDILKKGSGYALGISFGGLPLRATFMLRRREFEKGVFNGTTYNLPTSGFYPSKFQLDEVLLQMSVPLSF